MAGSPVSASLWFRCALGSCAAARVVVSDRLWQTRGPGHGQASTRAPKIDPGLWRLRSSPKGTSGDTFTVEAGSYRLVGEITDPAVLIDTPTRESDGMITVLAGQEQTATIDHARARVRVTRRGRPVAQWRMQPRRQGVEGAQPITLRASEQHTPITPGRYDATLQFGANRIEVTGIIFQGGATMDVPVNVD